MDNHRSVRIGTTQSHANFFQTKKDQGQSQSSGKRGHGTVSRDDELFGSAMAMGRSDRSSGRALDGEDGIDSGPPAMLRLDMKRATEDFTAFAHGGQAVSAQGVFFGEDFFDIEPRPSSSMIKEIERLPSENPICSRTEFASLCFSALLRPSCTIR